MSPRVLNDTGDGDSYTEEPTYDPGDNSYDGNTDSEAMEQIPRILQIHLQMEPVKMQAIMKIRTVAPVKLSMTMITVVLRIRILITVRPKIPVVMAPMI